MPQPSDIRIIQADLSYTLASTSIPLSSNDVFTVEVDSSVIEGNFKTIVATLGDPRGSGRAFSFLLRLNADRTVYQATIAAVNIAGRSDFTVEVYDYDSLVLATYSTTIVFTLDNTVASSTLEIIWYQLQTLAWALVITVPFLVLLWLWLVYRRREQDSVSG